jgi:hypothetical protein
MPQSKPNVGNKQTRNAVPTGEEQFYLTGPEANAIVNFFESKLDVVNFVWEQLSNKPVSFPPTVHTHTAAQITDLAALLAGKADTIHTHVISNITGLQDALDNKSNIGHTHLINQITGLETALDAKQNLLISGSNIKTINGISVLGAGNIVIDGEGEGSAVESVTGTGVDNTDTLNPVITLADVAVSGDYDDLINLPVIPEDISDLTDTTNLLFSGDYEDLDNKPVIPADISDLTDTTDLLFDGDYESLDNKPTIPVDISDLTDTGNLLLHEWENLGGDQSNVDISGFNNDEGFETPTQLNARDTANRSRANHTGTQAISTVDGLQTALDGKAATSHTHTASNITDFNTAVAANSAVTANTAKVTNATHTGEVTGATALTITNDVVTNSKLANMATKTYKGRTSSGTGDPEDVTVSTLKADLALNNVDNTSDANKPISTATQTALDNKQDDLGITDETTYLLTPKKIREGADPETKLITSQEADGKINQLPIVDTDFFENAEVSEDVFQLRPKFAPVSLSSQLPATGEQIAIFVAENTSISEIVASSGVVQFDNILRNYQNQNYSSLEVEGVVPVRRLILQRFGKLEFQDSTTINHSGFGWIIDGIGYEQDLDLEGQTVTGTPSTNPRIDILTGDNEGGITYTVGTELVTPVPPAIPTGQRLIASVLRATNGDNTITYAFEIDEKLEATTPSEAIAFDKLNIIEIFPTLFGKYAYTNRTVDIPEDDSIIDMMGAIAWFEMREIAAGNKIKDLSANEVDADIINPSTAQIITSDPTHSPVLSLAYANPRSYLQVPNNTAYANIGNKVTVMMKVKTAQSSRTFFHFYDGTVGFRLDSTNAVGARFQWKVNPDGQANTSTNTLFVDTWYWVACTVNDHDTDSGLMRLRIWMPDENGNFVSVGTATTPKTNLGNGNDLFIGSNSSGATATRENSFWAFFGLWADVLTVEQMKQVTINSGRQISS